MRATVRARPLRLAHPLSLWPSLVSAQVRARHTAQQATWRVVDDGELEVTFLEPVTGVAPGQALVVYDGDVVLGGGVIVERVDGLRPRRSL